MINGNDVYVPNRSGLSFHDIFSLHSYDVGGLLEGGGSVRYIMTLSIMFGILWVYVLTKVTPDYS